MILSGDETVTWSNPLTADWDNQRVLDTVCNLLSKRHPVASCDGKLEVSTPEAYGRVYGVRVTGCTCPLTTRIARRLSNSARTLLHSLTASHLPGGRRT